jgi:hypothetical protein
MKTKCKYCNYEWESRVRKPKACPVCKRYFPLADYQHLTDKINKIAKENSNNQKED